MKIADAHRREGRVDGSTSSGATVDNSTNFVTDDDVYVENYNSNSINSGNGDDAAVLDYYYDDAYNENKHGADDDGDSGSDYSQYYSYNNNGNNNQNYNKNNDQNNYNKNRYHRYNDDYNGGRRQLQSSQGKRIKIH